MMMEYGWERVEYFAFDPERSEQAAVTRQMTLDEHAKVDNMFGISTALQDMWDAGLIYLVNTAILHHFGYAIGVEVDDAQKVVRGLVVYRTSDPDGLVFDEESATKARQKLLSMMQGFAKRQVEARDAAGEIPDQDPLA
jgi:hypothetical protein